MVVYSCRLMLKCGKKRMPGTAGRKLDSRSNMCELRFQNFIFIVCALLANGFVCGFEKNLRTRYSFSPGVSKGSVNSHF